MKPLLLEIQAFGPFAGNESIDFTELGSNPLFLINGATGAGKSTILDAICFALYGQTTGAEREPSQMRCDFSDPSVLTEVTLSFSLGNKGYKVRRVPQQDKPKKSGEGITKQVAESQLWELDGTESDRNDGKLLVAKSVNDATNKIKELIGLEVEQFRQVMVLPQGKFRELLLADSRDREKIFGQLFQTRIYKQIEELLRSKASGIRQAVEDHQNQVRGILQSAEVNTEAEVTDQINVLAPVLEDAAKVRQEVEKAKNASEAAKLKAEQLFKRFEDLDNKQQLLTVALEQAPAIRVQQQNLDRAVAAQKIQSQFLDLQNEKSVLNKLESNLEASKTATIAAKQRRTNSEQALNLAKKAAEELAELTKQQMFLEGLEKQIEQLQQAQGQLLTAEASLVASQATLKNKQDDKQTLGDELNANEKSGLVLQRELESLGSHQLALQKLNGQLEQRKELETLRQKFIKQTNKRQACEQQFVALAAEFDLAETKSKKVEFSWHAGQAALLAKELHENEPCPVCGSETHPAPASTDASIELESKEAVDQARALVAAARTAMEKSKSGLDQEANALAQTNKECLQLEGKLEDLADQPLTLLEETVRRTEAEVAALIAKREILKKQQVRTEELKAGLLVLQTSLDALDKEARDARDQSVKARATVDSLLATIPEDYREANVLGQALASLKARIALLTKNRDQAEKEHDTARSEFDKTSTQYAEIEKQVKAQMVNTSEAVSTWDKSLLNSVFTSVDDYQSALLSEDEQSTLRSKIDDYRSELDALKAVVKQMQDEVADKVKPDLAAMETDLLEKQTSYKQADDNWRKNEARNNQLAEFKKLLDQANKTRKALEEEYKVIGTLSDVANGQTGDKISLNRFVLSVLLDDVLIQASQRLVLMSKGRYQLVRKEDRAKGNKASGLELEVEDGYYGTTRSVATLSGGESFLAALSLALGLSDVVQSYAGGIKLDTLFIDEGFGSLDPESLDLAVTTLIDLQASGRMIGIISHVSELKEQMALRLDVISDRSGSRIATVVA